MKSMTCRELGGACGFANHGAGGDNVIKAQDRHLREAVGGGDVAAEKALAAMKGRHVDFTDDLEPFYFEACGFRPTAGGIVHLPSLGGCFGRWGRS